MLTPYRKVKILEGLRDQAKKQLLEPKPDYKEVGRLIASALRAFPELKTVTHPMLTEGSVIADLNDLIIGITRVVDTTLALLKEQSLNRTKLHKSFGLDNDRVVYSPDPLKKMDKEFVKKYYKERDAKLKEKTKVKLKSDPILETAPVLARKGNEEGD